MRKIKLGRWAAFLAMGSVAAVLLAAGEGGPVTPKGDEPLVNGKLISPENDSVQSVGNLPMNMVVSADGRYAITCDMGYYESLYSIRTADGVGVSHVDFKNPAPVAARGTTRGLAGRGMTDRGLPGATTGPAQPGGEAEADFTAAGSQRANGVYYGLAISRNNVIYAAQGNHDSIAVLSLDKNGKLARHGDIVTRPQDFPAGIALDDNGRLYAANNASGEGNPFDLSGSVAIYDTATRAELGRYVFSNSHGGTSNFPLGIAAMRDGSKAYVAAERDDAVYALDTRDPSNPTLLATLPTGAHPVAVLLSKDQTQLFVANSLGDTVSIVDTKTDKITATIPLRPAIVRDVPGVTPVALAQSRDAEEDTLFVALGDMNAIAEIDIDDAKLRGYIPAGWYPAALAATDDGKRLLVANAKGLDVRNPNNIPDPNDPKRKNAYVLSILDGKVAVEKIPEGKAALQEASLEVLKDNRLDTMPPPGVNPLAGIGLAAGKIKHVIYIIKENRTYDQVLGDIPSGNGDPTLTLFGRDVTPNLHAIAERFVLMDNLFACGDVSGDGWAWSTQGMADAYVIRNVPYQYSHRGRKYDFEGQNNGYPTGGVPATDPDGNIPSTNPAFAGGATTIPDVGSTGNHLWDAASLVGVSMRNFGFFLTTADRNQGFTNGPDNLPSVAGLQPPGHDLAGMTDVDYRRFDLDYPDSDAPAKLFASTGDPNCLFDKTAYGQAASPSRFSEWNREFQMMLAKNPAGDAVPALMMVRLGNDHNSGAKSGKHTPASYTADNDYAVGQLVQAVSHSPIWSSTAIFVIEDDAQSGSDHVDAHRTTGYVISPWIKTNSVDHRFHNTDSFLKTMELLLGMPPLSQYDAVADPIMDWDTTPSNIEPFTAIMPDKSLIAEMNPRAADLRAGDPRLDMALASDKMDFTHADAAPALELDAIVWKTVKGPTSVMPTSHGITAAAMTGMAPAAKTDDDDDD